MSLCDRRRALDMILLGIESVFIFGVGTLFIISCRSEQTGNSWKLQESALA